MAAFVQFDRAFNRIWGVPQPQTNGLLAGLRTVVIDRGVAFLMLLLLGALVAAIAVITFLVSAIESTTGQWLHLPRSLHQATAGGVPFLLNGVALALLYRWIPRIPVTWPDALRGALFAAVGWEIGRRLLATFLIGTRYSSAYGVIGSFIAVQCWCYYMVAIVFLGAEYLQACRESKISAGEQDPDRKMT